MLRHRLLALALFLAPSLLQARHMEGRTGFGITLHDFNTTPCLSLRYHMSNYQSAVVLLGFDTDDDRKTFVVGGKFYQNAHIEENLNFYVGLGGYAIANKLPTEATTSTGLEISGILGGEWFFSGLPNLGFQFETGVALRTVRRISFATMGSGFFGGAIHYYF